MKTARTMRVFGKACVLEAEPTNPDAARWYRWKGPEGEVRLWHMAAHPVEQLRWGITLELRGPNTVEAGPPALATGDSYLVIVSGSGCTRQEAKASTRRSLQKALARMQFALLW